MINLTTSLPRLHQVYSVSTMLQQFTGTSVMNSNIPSIVYYSPSAKRQFKVGKT